MFLIVLLYVLFRYLSTILPENTRLLAVVFLILTLIAVGALYPISLKG